LININLKTFQILEGKIAVHNLLLFFKILIIFVCLKEINTKITKLIFSNCKLNIFVCHKILHNLKRKLSNFPHT
jgi:hypothetical protein